MTTASTAPTALRDKPADVRRAVLNTIKGSSGNLVEWYDVYAYTVFLTYFESHFFDPADENSTIYAYAVFAVTFLARPLGSWWFGRYADRRGRRASLTLAVSVMALGSFLISILPTRDSIGVWAAVALTALRLVQGFATGGEYGTSATYMSEAATADRRGFFSSFQYVTLVGGHVLAQFTLLILQAVMSKEDLTAWGWRIPFFIGGIAAIVVFWLRRTMDESLSAERIEASGGSTTDAGSVKELLTRHLRAFILCFLVTLGGTVAFYTYSVNGPAIVKSTFKGEGMTPTWINLGALIVLMLLQPLGGLISDKVGRQPLLVFFGVTGLGMTWVLITWLPATRNPWMAFLLLCAAYVVLTGYTSINAIVKAELFPAHIRALGVGLGYALANSAFGGTSPLIYAALKQRDAINTFGIYVTACIAISLFVYAFVLKNKAETDLDREQGSAYAVRSPSAGR